MQNSERKELEVVAVDHIDCLGVQSAHNGNGTEPALSREQAVPAIVTTFRDGIARVSCPYFLQQAGTCEAAFSAPPCPYNQATSTDTACDEGIPLSTLDLSVRANRCLRGAGIFTLEKLIQYTASDLRNIKNFGPVCLCEVIEKLQNNGLCLRNE